MDARGDLVTLNLIGADVVSHADRSLGLIRAIETTISALCYERQFLTGIASSIHQFCDKIKSAERTMRIDPRGELEDIFLKAQASVKNVHCQMVERLRYAENDASLTDEDGVAEEYRRSISVVIDLHNGINELRWAIAEYDADLSNETKRTFDNAEKVINYLRQ